MSGSDFWSRRRAAVRAEEAAAARDSDETARAAEEAGREAAHAEKTDEEILEELGLPDPDSIADGEGMRAFLARDVPERLRRRALRRFWRTNPVLANLDGLVDYAEDYRTLGAAPDGVETVYKVGRGMLAALVEDEEAEAATEGAAGPESGDEDAAEVPGEPVISAGAGPFHVTQLLDESPGPDEFTPSRAKRMRYTFES